jgi:hypothetical protein
LTPDAPPATGPQGGVGFESLVPEGERVVGEADVDEVVVVRGNAVEPWSGEGEVVARDRNYKVYLTDDKVYLVDYDYEVKLRTLAKHRESLEGEGYADVARYKGYATITRNLYVLPFRVIEKASLSISDGVTKLFNVAVRSRFTRPWGRIALGLLLLLLGIAAAAEGGDSVEALAGGSTLALLGLIVAVIYARRRIVVQEDARLDRVGDPEHASMASLRILVRDATPRRARLVEEAGGRRSEVEYDIDYYTLILVSYDEKAEGLREVGMRLLSLST